MPLPSLFVLVAFLVGLLFGSFLNVCISRLPGHKSVVKPRSHCLNCGHAIRWYDNIPLLSWIILRARCRVCKVPIPWRYPTVELAVGAWFGVAGEAIWRSWHLNLQTSDVYETYVGLHISIELGVAILGFLLIGLLVMDWQTHRLPDAFTLTGIAIGFFLVCVQAIFLAPGEDDVVLNTTHQLRLSSPGSFTAHGNVFLTGTENLVFGRVAAIAGAALLLLIVRWAYKAIRKRDGIGLGDVKMLAMIAAFLGFTQSLLALFIGVVTASLYGIVLITRRRAAADTRLPFGSFLAAGGLLSALFGQPIIGWYSSLLR